MQHSCELTLLSNMVNLNLLVQVILVRMLKTDGQPLGLGDEKLILIKRPKAHCEIGYVEGGSEMENS